MNTAPNPFNAPTNGRAQTCPLGCSSRLQNLTAQKAGGKRDPRRHKCEQAQHNGEVQATEARSEATQNQAPPMAGRRGKPLLNGTNDAHGGNATTSWQQRTETKPKTPRGPNPDAKEPRNKPPPAWRASPNF